MKREEIESFAAVEKLKLTEDELRRIGDNMTVLEESFDKLENINTDNTEPLVTVLDLKNVLRDDASHKMLTREELLSNAPEQYDGYFQVPKTLE